MLRHNTYPVIAHIKNRHALLPITAALTNVDLWSLLLSHEFGGVIDQVLKHLEQTRPISKHNGQIRTNLNVDISLHNATMYQLHCFARQLLKRNEHRSVREPPNTRKLQQIIK